MIKLKIVWWLQPFIDFIWDNRKRIRDAYKNDYGFNFDYPDYGGLPVKIYDALNSHHVDLIQEQLNYWVECRTKNTLAKFVLESITSEAVIISK